MYILTIFTCCAFTFNFFLIPLLSIHPYEPFSTQLRTVTTLVLFVSLLPLSVPFLILSSQTIVSRYNDAWEHIGENE